MAGRGRRNRARFGWCFALAVAGLAVAVALVVASAPRADAEQPAAHRSPSASFGWSNGLVLCDFNLTSPSVAVSALDVSGSGLSSGVPEITEITSMGQAVAVASVANANWTVVNASTPDAFDLAYQAHVLLVAPSGPATRIGSVDVHIDYILAEYAASNADNLSSVTAVLQISHWTWQGPGDRLVITLPLWPTFVHAEYLSSQSPAGPEITSSSNATGDPREYFLLSDDATATPASGAPKLVHVWPEVSLNPSFASVNLTVGSGAGAFTSLTYTALISIPLPSTVANLPLYEYVLVGGTATVVSIVVAAVTRRVRQRPSDMEYVEETP